MATVMLFGDRGTELMYRGETPQRNTPGDNDVDMLTSCYAWLHFGRSLLNIVSVEVFSLSSMF